MDGGDGARQHVNVDGRLQTEGDDETKHESVG